EDFASGSDLLMACIILHKQVEYINEKRENIIVPSEHMKTLRGKEQSDIK
ncbi:unnamed protein product, partial [Rotaria sp. Silwood2]